VKKFKGHSRMLKLSATSYLMKYEVRLPNLSFPPVKEYPSLFVGFCQKFNDLDLHRTIHSSHNCNILDAADHESNAAFVGILMSLYGPRTGGVVFQGGLVLYMATAVESLVYTILSRARQCNNSNITAGVDSAISSLYLLVGGRPSYGDSLKPHLSKHIERISAETENPRSRLWPVHSTEPFPDEALDKINSGTYSIFYEINHYSPAYLPT